MPAIGGSIESIAINGRNFAVAADADSNRGLGGYQNEVEPNGDLTGRVIQTATSWMLDGVTVVIDDSQQDHEFLQDLADTGVMFNVVISYRSTINYTGTGQLTGEINRSSQTATGSISFKGEGKLTQT